MQFFHRVCRVLVLFGLDGSKQSKVQNVCVWWIGALGFDWYFKAIAHSFRQEVGVVTRNMCTRIVMLEFDWELISSGPFFSDRWQHIRNKHVSVPVFVYVDTLKFQSTCRSFFTRSFGWYIFEKAPNTDFPIKYFSWVNRKSRSSTCCKKHKLLNMALVLNCTMRDFFINT